MAEPLTGRCNCGAIEFVVTSDFTDAGYCHCKRCQRRTGALWSLNAFLPGEHIEITRGRDQLRAWRPAGGNPKTFCGECGSHLFAGMPGETDLVGIRVGALDDPPQVEPRWHQWLESSPAWYEVPEDGAQRFAQRRE